jgi:hypothetical protein
MRLPAECLSLVNLSFKNRTLVLLLLAFWIGNSGFGSNEECKRVLTELLGPNARAESDWLAEFTPEAMDPTTLTELSDLGVFKVRHRNQRWYVVRLSSIIANAAFEQFAAAFVRAAPGAVAPQVRRLSNLDGKTFYNKVLTQNDLTRFRFLDDAEIYKFKPVATVALYYPATPADEQIAQSEPETILRKKFGFLFDLIKSGSPPLRLEQMWEDAGAENRSALISILKQWVPQSKDVSAENYLKYVVQNLNLFRELVPLIPRVKMANIPPLIRSQLADQWALRTALAIPDFNDGAWLFTASTIIGLDYALCTKEFKNGIVTIDLPGMQLPYNVSRKANYAPYISAAVAHYLESLNVGHLTTIAEANHYPLSQEQARGILGRIKLILKKRSINF